MGRSPRPSNSNWREYHDHLIKTIQNFQSIDEAIAACKKRFKNLPDRHFKAVEVLITHYFNRKTDL
jgi:hypothetical protein